MNSKHPDLDPEPIPAPQLPNIPMSPDDPFNPDPDRKEPVTVPPAPDPNPDPSRRRRMPGRDQQPEEESLQYRRYSGLTRWSRFLGTWTAVPCHLGCGHVSALDDPSGRFVYRLGSRRIHSRHER